MNPHAEVSVGMGNIARNLAKRVALGTDITDGRWSFWYQWELEPKSIEVTTCCSIAIEVIGWVGDQEGSHADIGHGHER